MQCYTRTIWFGKLCCGSDCGVLVTSIITCENWIYSGREFSWKFGRYIRLLSFKWWNMLHTTTKDVECVHRSWKYGFRILFLHDTYRDSGSINDDYSTFLTGSVVLLVCPRMNGLISLCPRISSSLTSILSCVCHFQDTIKSPPSESSQMKKATLLGIITTTFFYMSVAIAGYAAFGDAAPGNLLTGFSTPYWLVDFANTCIVIHLIGAYQVHQ